MQKNKKVLLVASATFALGLGASIPFLSGTANLVKGTDECSSGHHAGFHYAANAPTCSNPGNLEFWACCDCQHQYTTNPGGDFVDRDISFAVGGIDATHIAYVAPTEDHVYINKAVVEDGTVTIVNGCATCSEHDSAPIKTMVEAHGAGFEVVNNLASPWTTDGSGVYTSAPIGHSASSYFNIRITSAGPLTVNYNVSSEGTCDPFQIYWQGSSAGSILKVGREEAGTKVIECGPEKVGKELYFTYSKDYGGVGGRDNAFISFGEATFTYAALTFDTKGGLEIEPAFIENGRIVGELPTPTKEGAYFEGWFTDDTYATAVTASTVYDGNATIVAKWSEPLTVTLNPNGGVMESTSIPFQQNTTPVIPDPTKEGFTFMGWFTDPELTNAYVSGNKTASFELYASWYDNSQKHALEGTWAGWKGGDSTDPSSSYANMTVDVTGNYKVQEYYSSFHEGAFGEVDGLNLVNVPTSDDGTAIYDIDRGVVVFFKDTYKITSSSFRFWVFQKGNTPSITGVTCKKFKSAANNDTRLYSFVAGGETVNIFVDASGSGKFIYDAEIVGIDGNPLAVADMSTSSTMGFTVKENGVVYAEYSYDGSAYKKTSDAYRGVYTGAAGDLVVSGAGKALWADISTGVFSCTEISENKLYLQYSSSYYYEVDVDTTAHTYTYKVRTVTVTFDYNYEGAPVGPIVEWTYAKWQTIPEAAPSVTNPIRDGYTFDGWYDAAVGGSKVGNSSFKENKTIYAHWLQNSQINFVEVDGTPVVGVDSIPVVEGVKVSALPTPEKEGYIFKGWFTDVELTNEFTTNTVPGAGNITLYAKWVTPVTVGIHANIPGVDPVNLSVIPGDKIVTPNYARVGYYISGWYTDPEFTNAFNKTGAIESSMNLYAKWEEGVSATGSYKGFNLYSTGRAASNSLSRTLNVAADGTFSGDKSGQMTDGVNQVVTGTGNYFYYDATLGILWTAYGANTTSCGTDTNIFFRDSDIITKVEAYKYGANVEGSAYTALLKITYIDDSVAYAACFNNKVYGNVSFENGTFETLSSTGATGLVVKDSAGEVIFTH